MPACCRPPAIRNRTPPKIPKRVMARFSPPVFRYSRQTKGSSATAAMAPRNPVKSKGPMWLIASFWK